MTFAIFPELHNGKLKNTRLVPACLLMTCVFQQYQYCKECNLCSDNTAKMANMTTVIIIYNPGLHPAAPQSAQSSSGNHNQLWNGGVLGHCTDVERSSKSSAGNAQTFPSNYQFVRMGHFLPSSANRKWCAAAIFGVPKFANLLYSPVELTCLCNFSIM